MAISEAWEIRITREPEWDDRSRDELLALKVFKTQVCRGCGWHKDVVADQESVFELIEETCPVCAAQEQYSRVQGVKDRAWDTRLKDRPSAKRPADGRSTTVRLRSREEADRIRRTRAKKREAQHG